MGLKWNEDLNSSAQRKSESSSDDVVEVLEVLTRLHPDVPLMELTKRVTEVMCRDWINF